MSSPFRTETVGFRKAKLELTRNAVQCPLCKEIIESKYRWDFVRCGCGNCFVDGGLDYIRIGFEHQPPIDLAEYKKELKNDCIPSGPDDGQDGRGDERMEGEV